MSCRNEGPPPSFGAAILALLEGRTDPRAGVKGSLSGMHGNSSCMMVPLMKSSTMFRLCWLSGQLLHIRAALHGQVLEHTPLVEHVEDFSLFNQSLHFFFNQSLLDYKEAVSFQVNLHDFLGWQGPPARRHQLGLAHCRVSDCRADLWGTGVTSEGWPDRSTEGDRVGRAHLKEVAK